MPDGQYCFGRQWTREPPFSSGSQAHAPSTGRDVVTFNAFSTDALSSTFLSNWISIGAATPTVRSSPMFSVPRTVSCGFTVVTVPCTGTGWSSAPVARPDQV